MDTKKPNDIISVLVFIGVASLIFGVIATQSKNKTIPTPVSDDYETEEYSPSCILNEYEGERRVVFVRAGSDVFGGVDEPSSSVKGSIKKDTPGGIEANCGSYYRLQGTDWWGWVRKSDTYD